MTSFVFVFLTLERIYWYEHSYHLGYLKFWSTYHNTSGQLLYTIFKYVLCLMHSTFWSIHHHTSASVSLFILDIFYVFYTLYFVQVNPTLCCKWSLVVNFQYVLGILFNDVWIIREHDVHAPPPPPYPSSLFHTSPLSRLLHDLSPPSPFMSLSLSCNFYSHSSPPPLF